MNHLKFQKLRLQKHVKLIVSDIEGCLSSGKGLPLDLAALTKIQVHNRKAQEGDRIPLTLCTGRPQPFVEAFCQMLSVHLPCVCENGALLYDFREDTIVRHPNITERHLKALQELEDLLDSKVKQEYPYRREPGKEICISLNPDAPVESYADQVKSLYEHIEPYVDQDLFTVTHSTSAVDITPKGIDKAAGIRFLSKTLNIPRAHMLGIGDTMGDLPFLHIVGLAAAPFNAENAVKDVVQYVSPEPGAQGVIDIIT
jgi:HAD superfamily hydrolase (TIGR01484 family)